MGAAPKAVRRSAPRSRGVRWNDAVQSREALNEAKRIALIRAAGRAFKAKGFHNTSLDEVAALLNLTKPSLYYHVSSKADLLYQCHDYALDLGEAAFQYGKEGRDGLDMLRRTLKKYMESMTHDFAAYSVLSDLNDMQPAHKRAILKRRREFDTRFRALVSEGIADGTIRQVDPMLTVAWFMGAINAIPRWYSEEGPLSGEQIANAYTDLLTRGLQA